MALGSVAQIHVSVSDIDRAVAFYRDVLQIPFLFQVDGQPMAFFQSGAVRLYLGQVDSPQYRTHTVHYFAVDDLHAERARLEAAGVKFLDEPHGSAAGACWQLSARARMRALVVLPQPRGPEKR